MGTKKLSIFVYMKGSLTLDFTVSIWQMIGSTAKEEVTPEAEIRLFFVMVSWVITVMHCIRTLEGCNHHEGFSDPSLPHRHRGGVHKSLKVLQKNVLDNVYFAGSLQRRALFPMVSSICQCSEQTIQIQNWVLCS